MKAVIELIWTGSYWSTTIDQLCERAGVKRGSFHYFFESKAALTQAALLTDWEEYRKKLDGVFSPSIPPLERIHRYCEMEYKEQEELKRLHGKILGCPLCTLGSEISTLEAGLCETVNNIMDQSRKYFETTIRDAHAAGAVMAPNALTKSKAVYAYVEGLLTQARIRNELGVLAEMERGILDILGCEQTAATA